MTSWGYEDYDYFKKMDIPGMAGYVKLFFWNVCNLHTL